MKIIVIGGSGLIGKKLVSRLRNLHHEVVVASPSSGVNAVTGEGLEEALRDSQIVLDVTNSPSFDNQDVMEFFETSSRNILAAEAKYGIKHHIVLSIVGTDRLPANGYFQAKLAQEALIRNSMIPYTIVRATQFFEFAGSIGYMSTEGNTVRLPSALVQPISAEDVAQTLTEVALDVPVNGIIELAGPERLGLDEFIRRYMEANQDPRQVLTDETKGYFGAPLEELTLVPWSEDAQIAPTRYADWLKLTIASN